MSETTGDKIYIRDLHMRCIVGIFEEERHRKQDVVVNVTLHANLRKAGQSDRIEDTVDYKAIKRRIVELVEQSEYYLIERLAEKTAEVCLDDAGVEAVEVVVDKPGALRYARSVAVHIFRKRDTND